MHVLRRYDEGRSQNYQMHNEVAKLIYDLTSTNHRVNIYSLVTPERKVNRFGNNSRIISLGANSYSARGFLKSAIEDDKVERCRSLPKSRTASRCALSE